MKKLIDTHFHLDYYSNHKKVYKGINDLQQYTICVTNQPEIFESCIDIYPTTKYVKFAVGYNPQNINDIAFNINSFLRNIKRTNYVGEVGLDFSKRYIDKKEKQIEVFDLICRYSQDKIMTVHCKNAEEEEIYKILRTNQNNKVIIHWYSGDLFWLNQLLELGCYFSINGNMINSEKGKKIISNVPLNRLLVESDGPFSKIEGKKYEYNQLAIIYKQLGQTICVENIEDLITSNFIKLVD